jgi:hypothetical protein
MEGRTQRPKYQRKKPKKRKTQDDWTLTNWKDWLWKKFSQYIRLRDCIKTTGSPDYGLCVTCGKEYPRGELQAGHFIPGRTNAVLFDEDCTHAQCYRCNCVLDVWPQYYRWMQKEYGQEKIEQLIDQQHEKVDLTKEWIQEAYEYYENRIEGLLNGTVLLSGEGPA